MVTETKLEHCPFSAQTLPCNAESCKGCMIRIDHDRAEAQKIGENMKSYWEHQNCGAER